MSWQALSTVTRFKAKNPTEKLLMLLIANYADEQGISFPSQARLADDGSMDVRTVGRALASLEEQGAIKRTQRRRGDGSRSSDEILILYGRRHVVPGDTIQPDNLAGSEKGQPGNLSSSDHPAPRRGGPGTESDLEPTKEPIETPLKPPKGGDAKSRREPSPEAKEAARLIWAEAPKRARQASTSVVETAKACDAALKEKGVTPERLLAACRAYWSEEGQREGGRYVKGVHRTIECGRWKEWEPGEDDDGEPDRPAKPKQPQATPEQMAAHLDRVWRSRLDDFLIHKWDRHGYGPRPGEFACRAPAPLLAEYGLPATPETP